MTAIDDHYVTVAQAADRLMVSKSTLWRWIDQGDLKAYRLGHRRVLIKQSDLDGLITPARSENAGRITIREPDRLGPLTENEQKAGLAAIQKLRAAQEEMLRRRRGELFPEAADDLRELREQRSRELQ